MAKWTIDCATLLDRRATYEAGAGGWNDGRMGQACDLVAAIINEQQEGSECIPLLREAMRLIEEAAT